MKCALVVPAWRPEDIFPARTAGSQMNYWQPLGTLYVASSLIKDGHEVKFFNGAFETDQGILGGLDGYRPDFVGLYSTAFGWPSARRTASDIRKLLGGKVFVAAGGPYPIAMKEKCMTGPIDAVVTGEAELTIVEALRRLSRGESLHGVSGLVFRDGSGRVVVNPERGPITDLDSLPFPARELLGDKNDYLPPPASYKRKPVAVMLTSRGCDRRCIFCFQIDKKRSAGIRYRSVDNVLAEIEQLLREGYREIKFIDDTFAADYDRAMTLAKEIKRRGLDFAWFASACVNQVDSPLLEAFREAGCWAILFGVESGVQKNLKTIKKGITLGQAQNAVGWAREAGLKVFTTFVFGIPGETYEDGLETIDFACRLEPDFANFHALTPFPGAELFDNVERYGSLSDDLTDFTYQGAAFVPHTMSREEIFDLRRTAFKKFYSRPSYIVKRIRGLGSLQEAAAVLKGSKSLFWIWIKKDIFSKPAR